MVYGGCDVVDNRCCHSYGGVLVENWRPERVEADNFLCRRPLRFAGVGDCNDAVVVEGVEMSTPDRTRQWSHDRRNDDNTLAKVRYPWGWRMVYQQGSWKPVALSYDEWWEQEYRRRYEPIFELI